MTAREFDKYKHEAVHLLASKNEALSERFGIFRFGDYYYDLDKGTVVFSSLAQDNQVVATIQAAGSISKRSSTWLWAWANDSLPVDIYKSLIGVREFGRANGLSILTQPTCVASEFTGWELTSVAARIVDARGIYRFPSEKSELFVLLTDICASTE
ncbi:MAG TPA: hypothetical protein VKT51_10495 [Candidatus Eremiobacteraceae bacterium]|nr:hypothetical protein [Candidatus Eremiobacteraceae bacterium]